MALLSHLMQTLMMIFTSGLPNLRPELLMPLACGIAEVFPNRIETLNDIDLRRWDKVRRYCNLPGNGNGSKRVHGTPLISHMHHERL